MKSISESVFCTCLIITIFLSAIIVSNRLHDINTEVMKTRFEIERITLELNRKRNESFNQKPVQGM